MNIEQVDWRPFKSVALTDFDLSKDTKQDSSDFLALHMYVEGVSLILYPGEIILQGEKCLSFV